MKQQKQDEIRGNYHGFTIVELIVTMVVAGILSLALVNAIVGWGVHYAINTVRNTLTTNAQTGLNQISDDVRQSAGFIPANLVSDADAPSAVGQWLTGSSMLVLATTPRNSAGASLNITNGGNSGNYDNVVYYLSNGTLYRRLIASSVSGNSQTTVTCPATSAGGCPTDTKIVGNVQSVTFALLDSTGAPTASVSSAVSVSTTLQLQQSQSGQSVSSSATAIMTPRLPGQFYTTANFAVGPGGVQFTNHGAVAGNATNSMYFQGGINIDNTSQIGSSSSPIGAINVANYGCGTGASYGQSCAPAEPIAMGFFNGSVSASTLCATGQTTTNGGSSNTLTGLVAGCVAPKLFLPAFNKAARVAKMVNTAGTQSCGNAGGCAVTMNANTKYTGDVGGGTTTTYTINGDVYITGTLAGTSQVFKVANSVTTRPVIMVNGPINLTFPSIQANASGITPIFISFYSPANSQCSASDSCNYESPSDIYSNINSSTYAINLQGPIPFGGGSALMGGFYAYFGNFNAAQINLQGTVAAQRVYEPNSGGAVITLTNEAWQN